VGEHECRICGMPLEDSVCPMCGWRPEKDKDEAPSYRCPFCGAKLENLEKCQECGRSTEELEQDIKEIPAGLECSCPACLEKIAIEDETCPHCGIRIWLDIEKESKRLDVLRCPSCQTELSEDVEKCPKCGFDVWFEGDEKLEDAVLEVIKDAGNQLDSAKKEGVRLDKIPLLLLHAKKNFDAGHHKKAEKMANLVLGIVKSKSLQLKMYKDALSKAEKLSREVDEMGDTSEIVTTMDYARTQADVGKYKNALKLAVRAGILAEKIKGQKVLDTMKDYK
jgi:hypothetical protein